LYAGYLIKVETKTTLIPEYLNYVLNTQYAKKWNWEVKTDGVSQSNINAQKLGDFNIPLPPLKEQQEIVKRVEELFSIADIIETQYQILKVKIDSLPQAILKKAFKGELVPQDPNDEPARVLLERIKREKGGGK
jgi:type I restriction enzyme S subunit